MVTVCIWVGMYGYTLFTFYDLKQSTYNTTAPSSGVEKMKREKWNFEMLRLPALTNVTELILVLLYQPCPAFIPPLSFCVLCDQVLRALMSQSWGKLCQSHMRSTSCWALTTLSFKTSSPNCPAECVLLPLNHRVLWKLPGLVSVHT